MNGRVEPITQISFIIIALDQILPINEIHECFMMLETDIIIYISDHLETIPNLKTQDLHKLINLINHLSQHPHNASSCKICGDEPQRIFPLHASNHPTNILPSYSPEVADLISAFSIFNLFKN